MASQGQLTRISLVGVGGAALQLEVAPGTRVWQLRREAARQWELPPQCLRLLLGTAVLSDDTAVSELGEGGAALHVTVIARKRYATGYLLDVGVDRAYEEDDFLPALHRAVDGAHPGLLASAEHGDVLECAIGFRGENVLFVYRGMDGDVRLLRAEIDSAGYPVVPREFEGLTEFPLDYWCDLEMKDYSAACGEAGTLPRPHVYACCLDQRCMLYEGFLAAARGGRRGTDDRGKPCLHFEHRGQEYRVSRVGSVEELCRLDAPEDVCLRYRKVGEIVEVTPFSVNH